MHSHLIVVTFAGQEEATKVYDALARMRSGPLLGLENAAIVARDDHGRLADIRKRWLPSAGQASGADLTRSAVDLLFGDPPDDAVQALAKVGFDGFFREQVVKAMEPDCSALLFVLSSDSRVDRNRLLGILTPFKGRVYETTLPREAEAALVRGWEA